MKTIIKFLLIAFLIYSNSIAQKPLLSQTGDHMIVFEQASLDYNRIQTYIQNTGTFNRNIENVNSSGFMWPKGSNKFAIFTTGLTTAAYINDQLRMAAISYSGEYVPGTIKVINGVLTPYTDNSFKLYKVSKYDNCTTNTDWANWGLMVPYGAPYDDKNNNGQYDPCVDIPGVKNAAQTIFICLTDAFQTSHSPGNGFGGGTLPLNAEMRLTAWAFESKISGTEDAQFLRFQIINKNDSKWDSTRFSIICDPDLGDGIDDYVGCDTARQMGYCYNSDNDDGGSIGTYGTNPPAVGIRFLRGVKNKWSPDAEYFGMNGFCYFNGTSFPGPICERDPDDPSEAYNFMKCLKRDGTSWINPLTMQRTKFTYSGDPESGNGWTEEDGLVSNCGGADTGIIYPSPGGDRRFVMSTGRDDLTFNPLDTQEIIITQLIARGSKNLNSVTKLLQYSDQVSNIFNFVYVDPVSIEQTGITIPDKYFVGNNYPNPFNPITKIEYGIPKDFYTNITVYDIIGNEVAVLYNGEQKAGNYSVQFNGSNLASGIYFLKFKSGNFIETRKMILLK